MEVRFPRTSAKGLPPNSRCDGFKKIKSRLSEPVDFIEKRGIISSAFSKDWAHTRGEGRSMQLVGLLFVTLFNTGGSQQPMGEMKFPEGTVQHVVTAEEIQWKPCAPNLPSGCEIAVLEGNPQRPDLFTVRFRVTGEFVMPAHSHPQNERVTVLSGKMSVAFGKDATRESAKQFGPGDYYVNAREAVHVVWADEPSVIQITGIGPWKAEFVDSE